ncbi:MAG: hypothetical protein KDK66_00270 [Deltaproteobacteria bacterium]|nr:hypothetical protein [Deltaproteobacteria bacterium]
MIIFQQALTFSIPLTLLNVLVIRSRVKPFIQKNPDLKKGYRQMMIGFMCFANLPSLVISLGHLSGYTQNLLEYFYPKSMNPAVLAFYASIGFILLLGAFWIYLGKGADFLAKHPGFIYFRALGERRYMDSPKTIKTFWLLVLLMVTIGFLWLWHLDPGTLH